MSGAWTLPIRELPCVELPRRGAESRRRQNLELFRFVDVISSLESQVGNLDVLELDDSVEVLTICNEEVDKTWFISPPLHRLASR
jgi:hypothetical protein